MPKRPAPPVPQPAETDMLLVELACAVLSEHFFDPDREQEYKARLSTQKPSGTAGVLLDEFTMDLTAGECSIRLEALKAWTRFRVLFAGPGFATAVEGTWSFEREDLNPPAEVTRTGDPATIESAAEDMLDELDGPDLDDEEASNMLEMLEDEDDDAPLIGDDPKEPPPATTLERNRIKAIAKRMARMKEPDIGPEDRGWLEQMPQTLPVITDGFVAAAQAKKRDEKLIESYHQMLTLQLEYVRYRLDRGWAWAERMLEDYQQRLIAICRDDTISQTDWSLMAQAMTEARVPITDAVQSQLAEAGFSEDEAVPPEELMAALRGFLDDLARMVTSPFEVMEALKNSGALMPATLRSFMATELSLSAHAPLRDSVALMLLDEDSSVRRDVAGALEQTAHPDTMSGITLRRAIAVRNWIPPADRPAIDSAVRKGRLNGVETATWPQPPADLEFYATMVDGSGAQSVLIVSKTGKKGLFGGLLLRHGDGVVDTWVDDDLSRSKVSRLLREALLGGIFTRVDKAYVDLVVQHALAAGVVSETLPPDALLWAAECSGGSAWQDRGLDVAAEAERLFNELDTKDRTPEGIDQLHASGLAWMRDDPMMLSWYEDGPAVHDALAPVAKDDRIGMLETVFGEILPPMRMDWAERFLLMALWSRSSHEAKYRRRFAELLVVAHALCGDGPIGAIPVMGLIATQTVREALEGGW